MITCKGGQFFFILHNHQINVKDKHTKKVQEKGHQRISRLQVKHSIWQPEFISLSTPLLQM